MIEKTKCLTIPTTSVDKDLNRYTFYDESLNKNIFNNDLSYKDALNDYKNVPLQASAACASCNLIIVRRDILLINILVRL